MDEITDPRGQYTANMLGEKLIRKQEHHNDSPARY